MSRSSAALIKITNKLPVEPVLSLSDLHRVERKWLDYSLPADYSFHRMKEFKAAEVQDASPMRLGSVPKKGFRKKKLLTRSLWLSNNKLKTLIRMETFINSVIEVPSQLCWIDFSFNFIRRINKCLLRLPNLKILYFHGNLISDLEELLKLRQLKYLRIVTFLGNPISDEPGYRADVAYILPDIKHLDFKTLTEIDKYDTPTEETMDMLAEYENKPRKTKKATE